MVLGGTLCCWGFNLGLLHATHVLLSGKAVFLSPSFISGLGEISKTKIFFSRECDNLLITLFSRKKKKQKYQNLYKKNKNTQTGMRSKCWWHGPSVEDSFPHMPPAQAMHLPFFPKVPARPSPNLTLQIPGTQGK